MPVSVLDSGSYRARSVCFDTRTIRLGANPRKPDTSPGTLGRNSNLALALLAPAQLAHLGFGAFGSGGRFLGGKAEIASTAVASVTRKGDKIGVKLLPGIHMTMMMRGSICLIMINSRDVRRRWRYPTYHEKDEHELDTKTITDPQRELHLIKGILHQKNFYRLNLIFWIVMGCGIARFGRGSLKTTET